MSYTTKLPAPGPIGHVMAIAPFQEQLAKGIFAREDVSVFWSNDTHFDPTLSAWDNPQPADATRVVMFANPPQSGIIPPSSPV